MTVSSLERGSAVELASGSMGDRTRRTRHARGLFAGISSNYDTPAKLFGLFQYRRWHRELVSRLAPHTPSLVLDMCTGTGAVAEELLRQTDSRIVAADLTRSMLKAASERPGLRSPRVSFIETDAQSPGLADGSFDAVVFTYLLRYVEDVPTVLSQLGRLLRPGGVMASLEFAIPNGAWHPLWLLHTRVVLPLGLRAVSRGWGEVGGFLGPSISEFYRRWPPDRLEEAWREAGFGDVSTSRLSLGGAAITTGTRL
ncbi:MAG: methyltransferase domain-containing protein [Dehalococcoidia bacterium]|nr:methyltransferase domain-containing protein [Dehalococcoidia bacterium]